MKRFGKLYVMYSGCKFNIAAVRARLSIVEISSRQQREREPGGSGGVNLTVLLSERPIDLVRGVGTCGIVRCLSERSFTVSHLCLTHTATRRLCWA